MANHLVSKSLIISPTTTTPITAKAGSISTMPTMLATDMTACSTKFGGKSDQPDKMALVGRLSNQQKQTQAEPAETAAVNIELIKANAKGEKVSCYISASN